MKWTWLFQKPATTVLPVQSITRASCGNADFAAAADRGDDAIGGHNDRIGERRGIRRRVDAAAHEREGLRVGGDADAHGRAEEKSEKRGAEPDSRSCAKSFLMSDRKDKCEPSDTRPARPALIVLALPEN